VFSGGIRVRATPSGDLTAGELALVVVLPIVFFLLLLEERSPVGVGALPPSLGFKDFHHAARPQPPAGGHPQG
jgi:hypothetical protein